MLTTVVFLLASASLVEGEYEIQSLGADRTVHVTIKGSTVYAYRVMWPEWEGSRYKLEHLFRGRLNGDAIRGQLSVREEGLKAFDELRGFEGKLQGDKALVIDGMPLKRVGKLSGKAKRQITKLASR